MRYSHPFLFFINSLKILEFSNEGKIVFMENINLKALYVSKEG